MQRIQDERCTGVGHPSGGHVGRQLNVSMRWGLRRDLDAAIGIECGCFQFPWEESEFIERLRERNCIWHVAEIDGHVVGYVIYEITKNSIRILNFAVHPKVWRQKVGAQMVTKLTGKLSSERRNRITVDVWESNLDAQLFFKACGFQAEAIVSQPYEECCDDAIHFVYRLRNEVFRIAE